MSETTMIRIDKEMYHIIDKYRNKYGVSFTVASKILATDIKDGKFARPTNLIKL